MINTTQHPSGHPSCCILFYADGACSGNPGPGGFAAVLRRVEGGKEVKMAKVTGGEDSTTNNRMELTAAIRGLADLAKDEALPVIIRTDSQLVVKGMTEWLPGWVARNWRGSDGKPVKNVDLWQELVRQCEGKKVSFEWVRGHNGDVHNEEADRLAAAEAMKRKEPVWG